MTPSDVQRVCVSKTRSDDAVATFGERLGAAVDAFKNPTVVAPRGSRMPEIDQDGRYDFLWDFWYGRWTYAKALDAQRKQYPDLYANTRQLWRQADAIVSLYEQYTYIGDLSTDGKALPDGTEGAIPINPQTPNESSDDQLRLACAELWQMWNWRAHMSLRPKFTAILGDCLTELVDDPDHGTVMPRTVWPGYVTDIDLDLVGNVKRYTVEYWIEVQASNRYGQHVDADRYRFRKEVDGTAFRYFRDDDPHPAFGNGTGIVRNNYGFVPAIWDRFEPVWGNRGMSALERTMQQVLELNSFLSHVIDHQGKGMAAPVGVVGAKPRPRSERLNAIRMLRGQPIEETDPDVAAHELAEQLDLMPMNDKGAFITINKDIGQAIETLKFVMDSIVAESPESRYGQDVLQMTQVTAPGVERALGVISGRLHKFRGVIDPQTVKLHQMAIAMIGWRLSGNQYDAAIVNARPARYKAFEPFGLDSWGEGMLDFTIPTRPWIPETIDERLAQLVIIEGLQTEYALRRAGVDAANIRKIMGEREAEQARMDAQITGIGAPNAQPNPRDGEDREVVDDGE
jgi:hypothetical protein